MPGVLNSLQRDRKRMRAASKLTRRIQVKLEACPDCDVGCITAMLWMGQDRNVKAVALPDTPLSVDNVRELREAMKKK
jgi:hypothetical protein